MQLNNITLRVLVKGRAIKEHVSPLNQQTFIEGREGSEFEIEVTNNNHFDVEAVISVDGRSITDGEPAGQHSRGYILRANKVTRIPGWKVDGDTAAKFTFTGAKGGSYVEQVGGEALNKGVIGLMVYKPLYVPRPPVFRNPPVRAFMSKGMGGSGSLRSATTLNVLGSRERTKGISGGDASWASDNIAYGNAAESLSFGATTASMTGSATASANNIAVGASIDLDALAQQQTLGTEFGEATQFQTTEVQFQRGDLLAMLVLYYDDKQGLKRYGIDFGRKPEPRNPFPADHKPSTGCTVPEGWSPEGQKAALVVSLTLDADPTVVAEYIRLKGITVVDILPVIRVIKCEVKAKNAEIARHRLEEIEGILLVSQEDAPETL